MDGISDEDLVRLAKGGDTDAFSALASSYQGRIFNRVFFQDFFRRLREHPDEARRMRKKRN